MKRGSQLTLKINSLEFPSTGISECEGKKIYVKGAFPGQRVKATVKNTLCNRIKDRNLFLYRNQFSKLNI